jgi:mRNA interferase MazF
MESRSMTKGKVVLVPFPFDDLSGVKVRPAVGLTDPIGFHRNVVLAFLTSQVLPTPDTSDLMIDSGHPDFRATGLHLSSTVRLHRLVTASTSVIRRELGVLSAAFQAEVGSRLRALFGL